MIRKSVLSALVFGVSLVLMTGCGIQAGPSTARTSQPVQLGARAVQKGVVASVVKVLDSDPSNHFVRVQAPTFGAMKGNEGYELGAVSEYNVLLNQFQDKLKVGDWVLVAPVPGPLTWMPVAIDGQAIQFLSSFGRTLKSEEQAKIQGMGGLEKYWQQKYGL